MKNYKATVFDGKFCRHFEKQARSLKEAREHFSWFGEVLSVYLGTPGQPDYRAWGER